MDTTNGDMTSMLDAQHSLSICEFKDPTKRNLIEDFATPLKELKDKKHMNVYLRVRPFTSTELKNNEDKVNKILHNLASNLFLNVI